ncbi:MAG: cation diffusion facilitator family transporter [Candidatus Hodarchaeota archaeon]
MVQNKKSDAIKGKVKNLVTHERKALLVEGEKATVLTLLTNLLLIFLKISIGILIGSVALLASGLDAMTDLIASLTVLLGLRFSQKDPSKRFPYGYYRLETLATLIVSIIILLFGLDVLIVSSKIIVNPTTLTLPVIGLLMSLMSILIAFGLYRYNLRIGTKIASNALIETAKEFQLDMITNSLVFVGILAHIIKLPQLEGLVGLIISLFIIKTGIEFSRNSLLTLLDAIDDPEIIDQMQTIVSQFPEIQRPSNIRIRRSGPYYFADLIIQMHSTETIESLSQVTHKLEASLKKENPLIDSIMVSVEPISKTRFKIAIAVPSLNLDNNGLPAEHLGLAPAFLIADVDIPGQTIISKRVIENPHRNVERKRGLLSAELLVKEGIDILATKDPSKFGIGPKAILSENNVSLYPYSGNTIQEILTRFMLSKLKP